MSELMVVWFSFNVVFGLWSARNWLLWLVAEFTGGYYSQSTAGKLLDLVTLVSCISQYLIVTGFSL